MLLLALENKTELCACAVMLQNACGTCTKVQTQTYYLISLYNKLKSRRVYDPYQQMEVNRHTCNVLWTSMKGKHMPRPQTEDWLKIVGEIKSKW